MREKHGRGKETNNTSSFPRPINEPATFNSTKAYQWNRQVKSEKLTEFRPGFEAGAAETAG